MARIRDLDPSLPHEESLRDVSDQAKLLGVLLFLFCDDSGRGRIDFIPMTARVMPYVEDAGFKIAGWFTELVNSGWLVRYQVDGVDYFRMPLWKKYQRVDRPTASRLPGQPRKRAAEAREESEEDSAPSISDAIPREDFSVEAEAATREEAAQVPMTPAFDATPREDFFVEADAATREAAAEVPMSSASDPDPREESPVEAGALAREEAPEMPMPPVAEPIPREESGAPIAAKPPFTAERVLLVLDKALTTSLQEGGSTATARYIELAGRYVGLWGGRGAPVGRKEPANANKSVDEANSAQETSPSPDVIMRGRRS